MSKYRFNQASYTTNKEQDRKYMYAFAAVFLLGGLPLMWFFVDHLAK